MDRKINNWKPHIWNWSSNFRFSSRSSQSQEKLATKSFISWYSFMQKTSLILRTSTYSAFQKIYFHNIVKNPLTWQIFQQTFFWLVSEKNICSTPFLGTEELHSRSIGKANVCILLYVSTKNSFSRELGIFLLVCSWIIFLRRLVIWLCKTF